MKFPCIANLSSQDTELITPWEFKPKVPKFNTKRLYKEWLAQESTKHCLYSGFTGVVPSLRIHREANPVHSIHALVADYDSDITQSDIESMLDRSVDLAPNWVHTTPSGGARLVWIIERPVLVATAQILKKTLTSAAKALDLKGLLPGFDFENAFLNFTIYYDVGLEWCEVEGSSLLPASVVEGWMLKASSSASWSGTEVPLPLIEKAVHERFPGRWEGPFEEGSRGVRFWDPMADNPTAAVVRPTGMQCFTGPSGFVSWSQIFGVPFIEQFTAKRVGDMLDGIWYDGRSYWYQSADEKWESRAEKEMIRFFKVEHGLSADREKGAIYSEVEQALHLVDQHRRVAGAAPFVYFPTGMIEFMGRRVLNTASVKVLSPAEGVYDWGENFPWIQAFIETLFGDEEQVLIFISWLKRFYCSALAGRLLQGQAVFIAGTSGKGKTLLSNMIVSGLVGGHMDAASFMLGGSSFNKNLYHVGLWTIDDATPGDSVSDHKKFSSLLKKVTANTTFEYHAKFADSAMVEWCGRVVITGNIDAESLRILPDLDTSILDKLLLFKIADIKQNFPEKHELAEIIHRELPYLAAFLTHFEIPSEYLSGEQRYGIVNYHHRELKCAAGETTDVAVLEQILDSFIAERKRNREPVPWVGTATALMQEIYLDDVLKSLVGRNSAKWFAINLGKLEAQKRFALTSEIKNNRRLYSIGTP
jgi:hypothetical protein